MLRLGWICADRELYDEAMGYDGSFFVVVIRGSLEMGLLQTTYSRMKRKPSAASLWGRGDGSLAVHVSAPMGQATLP